MDEIGTGRGLHEDLWGSVRYSNVLLTIQNPRNSLWILIYVIYTLKMIKSWWIALWFSCNGWRWPGFHSCLLRLMSTKLIIYLTLKALFCTIRCFHNYFRPQRQSKSEGKLETTFKSQCGCKLDMTCYFWTPGNTFHIRWALPITINSAVTFLILDDHGTYSMQHGAFAMETSLCSIHHHKTTPHLQLSSTQVRWNCIEKV